MCCLRSRAPGTRLTRCAHPSLPSGSHPHPSRSDYDGGSATLRLFADPVAGWRFDAAAAAYTEVLERLRAADRLAAK